MGGLKGEQQQRLLFQISPFRLQTGFGNSMSSQQCFQGFDQDFHNTLGVCDFLGSLARQEIMQSFVLPEI
jgi:hypothetical protein